MFRFVPPILFTLITLAVLTPSAAAQSVTNRTVGIAGKMDYKARTPDLGVTVNQFSGRVQILADAYIPNEEYQKFPIQFDFYINRRLFSTQLRSSELPGAVGVDVARDVAVPPFNYAVVAKLLTPNGRPFTTILQGAVFGSNLVATLDCTLTANSDTFVDNSLTTDQVSNGSFELPFSANSVDGGSAATLSGSLSVSGESVSGTLSVNITGENAEVSSKAMTGTAEFDSNQNLTSFSVVSGDEAVTVSCS